MNLFEMGWSADFSSGNVNQDLIARIVAVHRSRYKAITVNGEINCYLSGRYQFADSGERIAVGDWCILTPSYIDEQNKPAALIEQRLPRKSKISRISSGATSEEQVIAANIDYAFIVTSANADLNVKRLHRYILLAQEGGVTPIVILSKVDLVCDHVAKIKELQSKLTGIDILGVSIEYKTKLEPLLAYLSRPGITGVFLGSSGVGKSSLVNKILNKEVQAINAIRKDDAKGRHTTTARELFFLPHGGMIIDTPGLREIQVFGDERSFKSTFKKIDEICRNCRFSNCTHTNEPGCAVLDALEKGTLDRQELLSFQKLLREVEYSNRKMNKRFASNQKRKWKSITKAMRDRNKGQK